MASKKSLAVLNIKSRSRKKYKKRIIILFSLIVVLGVIVIGFNYYLNILNETKCVKVQASCCPCSSGGLEDCVLVADALDYEFDLNECSATAICPHVYNCKKCVFQEGKCVLINGE